MKETKSVKVWKITTTMGQKVKVATIDQNERKPSMCKGCSSPCCQGNFRPFIDSEEFLSKKFPTMFMEVPEWLREKGIEADKIAVLAFSKGPYCNYFDPIAHKCTIYPNCPKACLAYDCREDSRPEIKSFVKERIKEWQEQ